MNDFGTVDAPHADTVFVEQLRILAEQGNTAAVMKKLLRRPAPGVYTSAITRHRPQDPRDRSLVDLGLNERTTNILEDEGWVWGYDDDSCPRAPTIGLLCRWSSEELLDVKGVGESIIVQIRRQLATMKMKLRGD